MSEVQENAPQVRITISEVLSLLDQGKSRKEIAVHFGQTQVAMQKMVWSHPKLKARKAKKQYADLIMLEDDVEEAVAEAVEVEVKETFNDVTDETIKEATETVEEATDVADSPQWS